MNKNRALNQGQNGESDKEKNENLVEGVVTEALPNVLFRVKLGIEEKEILAYLAGRMRINRIRVLVGDRVSLILDPYGGKARIVKRL